MKLSTILLAPVMIASFCLAPETLALAAAQTSEATANASAAGTQARADTLPIIPIGLDAYRHWDQLPFHKIGIRAFMRSTYDREGNNRTADASHFLYQEADDFNVSLDVKGHGILYFKRTNHFHGSPWHYEVDGRDTLVKETATDDPIDAKKKYPHTTFVPEELFPHLLAYTWATTKGADLMWVPLAFEERLRLAYSRTLYGTGYYIYHLIPRGTTHLSRPLERWTRTPPGADVLNLLGRAGTDIVGDRPGMRRVAGTVPLASYGRSELGSLPAGPHVIRSFKLRVPRSHDFDFGRARLRVTWDNRWHASIDAPLGLFFGAGEFYNPAGKRELVKALPLNVRYEGDYLHLACYWPMPYLREAVFELIERNGKAVEGVDYEFQVEPYPGPPNHVNLFHATYSDHPHPVLGEDVLYLDTQRTEGGGDWSGHFVGMSWIFTRTGNLSVLEGDPRFFFDDSQTPQAMGTGSEEWGGGGDYWGGETMTLPLAGHPIGQGNTKRGAQGRDLINAAYRFLIADYFPFGKRAVIRFEHGSMNSVDEHLSGLIYWYGVDRPSLVLTDEFNVAHAEDRQRHRYSSPTASEDRVLVSRYEWGPDADYPDKHSPKGRASDFYAARSYYFAHEDRVRTMTGTTRFTMRIRPDNHGVLLRRKFDYQYPNQEARVSVRKPGAKDWAPVGVWYTAGSNTCVYSRPEGKSFTAAELAPTEHHVITSNRRWRDDEFPIAATFTRGAEELEVQLEFVPNTKELYPGFPFPAPSAWSEARYWAYTWVLPNSG